MTAAPVAQKGTMMALGKEDDSLLPLPPGELIIMAVPVWHHGEESSYI